MRFCIRRRSARSEILVQSSSGFAELLKALLLLWLAYCLDGPVATGAVGTTCADMGDAYAYWRCCCVMLYMAADVVFLEGTVRGEEERGGDKRREKELWSRTRSRSR